MIVAGSVANIALFLDRRGSDDQVMSDLPRGDAAGVAASVEIDAIATAAPAVAPVDTEPPVPPPVSVPPDVTSTTYTVVSGDVLHEIAVRHGTTATALVELNNLVNPNVIEVGQVLLLPSRDPVAEVVPEPTAEPAS